MGRANTNNGHDFDPFFDPIFDPRFSYKRNSFVGVRLFSHSNSNCYAFRGAVFVKKYV